MATLPLNGAFSLARVAQATGNPIECVGFQCSDCAPFFKFSASIYTIMNPRNAKQQRSVNVYLKSGSEFTRIGSGYQTGNTLSYQGSTYAYQNEYIIARIYKVNQWSLRKPIKTKTYTNKFELSSQEWLDLDYGYEIPFARLWEDFSAYLIDFVRSGGQDLIWTWTPPEIDHSANGPGYYEWFRMLDFAGYDSSAVFQYQPVPVSPNGDYAELKGNPAAILDWASFRGKGTINLGWVAIGTSNTIIGYYPLTNSTTHTLANDHGLQQWITFDDATRFNVTGDYKLLLILTTFPTPNEETNVWVSPPDTTSHYWWLLSQQGAWVRHVDVSETRPDPLGKNFVASVISSSFNYGNYSSPEQQIERTEVTIRVTKTTSGSSSKTFYMWVENSDGTWLMFGSGQGASFSGANTYVNLVINDATMYTPRVSVDELYWTFDIFITDSNKEPGTATEATPLSVNFKFDMPEIEK